MKEKDRWYKKLWQTKGIRFLAANRLELKDKWSTLAISFITVYIISLNLVIIYPKCKRHILLTDLNITYSTICLSVLILAISLIVASKNYKVRAEKLHECGRKIDNIYTRVCIWRNFDIDPKIEDIETISNEYSILLDNYENHLDIDYLLFKAYNLSEFEEIKCKWFYKKYVVTKFYIQTIGVYILAIISPILLFLIL